MSALMKSLLYPYMAPAGADDAGAAGKDDAKARGDFVDDGEDDAAAAAAAAKAKADAGDGDGEGDEDEAALAAAAAAKAAAGDDGEEGDAAGKKKTITVPKARLDEAITKGKEREAALRAQIEALTRTSSADATSGSIEKVEKDIAELEAKHKQALDDGKSDIAMATLREIRIRERQIAALQSESLSDRARALAVEQVKVDLMISRLEVEFPQLDPQSEDYDQDTVDEVLFLRQSFEAKGLPSSEALSRAMKYVFASAPAAPAGDDGEKKGLGAGKKAADRKTAAVGKAVDAAGKQPAAATALGKDSDAHGGGIKGKVSEMTEEEYDALPESTKARLRGDFVE